MSWKKGYKWLPNRFSSIGTQNGLTIRTALAISSVYDGMDVPFLAKAIDYQVVIQWAGHTDAGQQDECLFIGLAQGNLSVTELKEAIEATFPTPEDPAEAVDDTKRQNWIVNKAFRMFRPVTSNQVATGTSWSTMYEVNERIDFGKGILFPENVGFQIFVYNVTTTSVTTGSELNGFATVEGVYLND